MKKSQLIEYLVLAFAIIIGLYIIIDEPTKLSEPEEDVKAELRVSSKSSSGLFSSGFGKKK